MPRSLCKIHQALSFPHGEDSAKYSCNYRSNLESVHQAPNITVLNNMPNIVHVSSREVKVMYFVCVERKCGGRGATTAQWLRDGLPVNRGMIYNKSRLITAGCTQPSFTVQTCGLKQQSLHSIAAFCSS